MSNYAGEFIPNEKNNNWRMAFDMIRPDTKILDVGCSNGNFGNALIKYKKCKVDGIEPDPGDAKEAMAKLDHVFQDTIENTINREIKDNKYDHIVFLDVIEHLQNPVDVMKSLKKHLNQGGSIVFSLPNMSHISIRLMLLNGGLEYGKTGILDQTHLHFYNQHEINTVFNQAGFEITNLEGMIVEYDEVIIKDELMSLGIKHASPDMIRVLKSNNAEIYQYIGTAKPVTKKNIKKFERKFSSPNPKKVIKSYKELSEQLESVTAKYHTEVRQHHKTRAHLMAILESNSFRLGKSIMLVPGYIKKSKETRKQRNDLAMVLSNFYGANKSGKIIVGIISRYGTQVPSSSTFLRIISPLTYKLKDNNFTLKFISEFKTKEVANTDVCIVQRTAFDDLRLAKEFVKNAKLNKTVVIVDTDDAFTMLEKSHPQYSAQTKRVAALKYVEEAADRIWVSTDKLVQEHKQKRTVYKNSVDNRLWNLASPSILEKKKIRLLYMGTTTHDEDFNVIFQELQKINEKYPRLIELTMVGVSSDVPSREWIINLAPPKNKIIYPYFVQWFQKQGPFDVGVAPLVNSEFNKAKSDIKVLDYLCIGVLPFVSNLEPYKNIELDDFVVRVGYEQNDWFNVFEDLILDRQKYKKMKEKNTAKIKQFIDKRSVKYISEAMQNEINGLIDNKDGKS